MFHNITLEISLKPFKQTEDAYIRAVCQQVFEQWRPLLKGRKSVSIMLWVGDGSEILDYSGSPEDRFEWARFIGTANLPYREENQPPETSLHERKQDYMPNAPVMTYRILKKIISCFKEEGKKALPNTVIRVGETFDIGPEFAISDFKYARHREICVSSSHVDRFGFIDATGILHGDDHHYAAYPNGIPEGTPFGTFLGKQSEIFLRDMGFDFLWLSNGLGFSADPWKKTGKIFDGQTYYPEKLSETSEKVFSFWQLFRKECSFPLETRGTNNSVGIDYASDGVPLYDIYQADLGITAPPNSPWAALNDNFGLELMGHMTRICHLPSERFPFRYYIHDPWWVNSPWYDRYDACPHDIYLPMAISRIDEAGKVCSANSLNILSIDNSYGTMPDSCVNEPLPHLLKAEKDVSDEAAPLVWVYPMKEYTTSKDASQLREMNLGDQYICDAINDGLPLCCVVATDLFSGHDTKLYQKSLLISPVPEDGKVLEKLKACAKEGIGVLMYGTRQKLDSVDHFADLVKLDVEQSASHLREALADFGYQITFHKKDPNAKPPTMTIARHDNAWLISAYSANTMTDTGLAMPLGAPVLCGMEAEMKDGMAFYRFGRMEHRECRVLVKQAEGIISCREAPPVSARYRRAIHITGLKDATLYLFSEKNCECSATMVDTLSTTPVADTRFVQVQDQRYGACLKGEHISGNIFFLIGHRR